MKKIFKNYLNGLALGIGFLSIILIAFWSVKARSGLTSSPGDKLTSTIWNQLIGNVIKTNGAKSMTSNGLYCGSTPSYDGAGVGGYAGAKTKCETACGDPLAHMCNNQEILSSKTLGIAVPNSIWFSTFTRGILTTVPNPITDCDSWTSNTSSSKLGFFVSAIGTPSVDRCSTAHPIACCK